MATKQAMFIVTHKTSKTKTFDLLLGLHHCLLQASLYKMSKLCIYF